MKIPSRLTFSATRHVSAQPWSLPIILLGSLLLSACDSVPNEPTVTGGGSGSSAAAYTGEACNAVATDQTTVEDICNFQTEFWAKMLDASDCENCHNTETGSQEPYFLDTAEINTAYGQMISRNLVDRTTPANSTIVSKINAGHNCGSPSECAVLATNATNYITNWVNGGVAGAGTGTEVNEITLTAPTIMDTGSSKNFPDPADPAPAGFTAVHDLLVANCANCHRDSASVPQAPFFADADVDVAYDAVVTSQKISLDIPRDSRLVARMDEGHNCWDLDSTSAQAITEGRKNCAIEMQQAIEAFAGTIPTTAVPANWVTSKAMTLLDGIVASGGTRDDSSTIALYEFKTGSGNTILDTSGVGVPLNLTLYGNEGTDYSWVGGWGIEFHTGSAKAQANTQDSRKLLTSILGSGEYSIEAWVVPANVSQGTAGDPARIINYSGGSSERNFTLGQAEYRYEFMNRTSETTANAAPSFITDADDEDLQSTQQHVVVTFNLTEGRKVYVNGEDVSTTGNADVDTLSPIGNLTGWDPTYAFSMGNEADFSEPFEGKLRLVAIHNRAMTPTQIQQNFDAGVGQKFYLMFSVSDQVGDPNCFLASAVDEDTNPNGDQCFVYFVASQFDTYSYLFTDPTFVSLNPAFAPSGTVVKGMRIGLNGKEPAVGQAFINLDTTLNATDYDAATGKQVLSNVGTIIALEKGAGSDEFFLTFEDFGGNQDVRTASVCGVNMTCTATAPTPPTTPAPRAGLRTFEEILVSMSAMTGVDPYDTVRYPKVLKTYYEENAGIVTGIKQALPSAENINGFLAAHEMAVAQLAIAYCDALVDDTTLRTSYFPGVNFAVGVDTAFPSATEKNQVVDALYNKMVGIGGTALSNMPSLTQLQDELVSAPAAGGYPGNLFDRLYSSCAADASCSNASATRTAGVVKAMCTSVLGSAAMMIQ